MIEPKVGLDNIISGIGVDDPKAMQKLVVELYEKYCTKEIEVLQMKEELRGLSDVVLKFLKFPDYFLCLR